MATLYGWYSIESEKEHGAKIYETVEGKVAKVSKVSHSASFRPRDMKFVGRLKKIATPNKIKASQTLATPVIPTSAAVERAKMRKRAVAPPKAESTDLNTDSTSDEPEPAPEPKRAPRPAEPKVVVNAAAERTRLRRAQNAVTPAPAVAPAVTPAPVVTPKQSTPAVTPAPVVTPKQSTPAVTPAPAVTPKQSAAAPTRSARAAMNRAKAVAVTEGASVTTTKVAPVTATKVAPVTATKVAPVTTTKTPPAAVSQPPPKALIPDRVVTSRATRAARTTARPTRESAVAQPVPEPEPEPVAEPVLEPIDDFLIVEDETPVQPTADEAVDDAADTAGGIGDVIDDYLPEDAVGAADVPEVDESDLDGLISSLGEF